jgi:hypothetical protein
MCARRVGTTWEDAVRFTFASSIYVLACGHSSGVRSNNVAETGDRWHCVTCDAEQVVTDVVTFVR